MKRLGVVLFFSFHQKMFPIVASGSGAIIEGGKVRKLLAFVESLGNAKGMSTVHSPEPLKGAPIQISFK